MSTSSISSMHSFIHSEGQNECSQISRTLLGSFRLVVSSSSVSKSLTAERMDESDDRLVFNFLYGEM